MFCTFYYYSGKSSLLNALTSTESEAAAYEVSTLDSGVSAEDAFIAILSYWALFFFSLVYNLDHYPWCPLVSRKVCVLAITFIYLVITNSLSCLLAWWSSPSLSFLVNLCFIVVSKQQFSVVELALVHSM